MLFGPGDKECIQNLVGNVFAIFHLEDRGDGRTALRKVLGVWVVKSLSGLGSLTMMGSGTGRVEHSNLTTIYLISSGFVATDMWCIFCFN
jgi:hypothetical protein